MALRDELETQGNWLFRWRSYFPLVILPVLLIALQQSGVIERVAGDTADTVWEIFCVTLSLVGLLVRCITIGYTPHRTSGRNTKKQLATVLNTTGMYSIVRHPLYLGNYIISLGLILFVQVWWFGIMATLAFWLYYERIIFAEEAFLEAKFGSSYIEWAGNTPAFLPRFKNWKRPELPFSFRNVLKREYSGLFLISTSFPILDYAADILSEGKLQLDLGWNLVFLLGLIAYLMLRTLKKITKVLHVEGR